MKKFNLILILSILCGTIAAQDIMQTPLMQRLCADHSRYGANVYAYTIPTDAPVMTPAPKGYKPFYISHYGRHGSRADMGQNRYTSIIATLEKAQADNLLTPQGDSLLTLARQMQAAYNGMDRRLTEVGQQQHYQLGCRMYERFPQVFGKKGEKKQVRAVTSEVPRCIVSMAAFTNGLTSRQPGLQYKMYHGLKYQEYINCRGLLDTTYPITRPVIDSLMNFIPYDDSTLINRIFTDPKKALEFTDESQLQYNVCEMFAYAQSFGIVCDPFDFVSPVSLYRRDARMTYHFYLNFCNAEGFGTRRRAFAQNGLNDIIEKADEVIANGNCSADLRFGHDDPLLCIVSLMELEGVGDKLSYDEILNKWFAYENVAMASNVQVVFYRAKNKEVLVKVLYNEKETHIHGLQAVNNYYYRWTEVRQLWLHTHRLATYNVRYINRNPAKADKGNRSWGERYEYVIRNVIDNHFDIVGMQEVTGNNTNPATGKSQLQDLKDGLKEYTCIAYEREDKDYSYNAIFYRTDKYDCISHYSFWLSETPEKASFMGTSKYYRRCIVALMEDKLTKQRFYFADAHTDFDPLDVGEKQAQLIGERLLPLTKDGTPLVLVGDLNHDRYDKPSIYAIFAKYFEDANLPNHDSTPTYKKWCTISDDTYRGLEIDYHFYRNMTPVHREVVTEDYGRNVPPSDHFPVYVDFQLNASRAMDEIK